MTLARWMDLACKDCLGVKEAEKPPLVPFTLWPRPLSSALQVDVHPGFLSLKCGLDLFVHGSSHNSILLS